MLVLIDEDSLMGRVEKAGILDTGEKISPGHGPPARLRGRDHPRSSSAATPSPSTSAANAGCTPSYQRYAMLARDQGCRAEGCDRTTGLHAHHKTRWADGGDTNVSDGVTLCHWHHTKAHDTSYETTYHPNGDVSSLRRSLPPACVAGRPVVRRLGVSGRLRSRSSSVRRCAQHACPAAWRHTR